MRDGEFIVAWPESPERLDYAERQIRDAMVQQAVGNITQDELSSIFSILSFAMPDDYFVPGEER